MFHFKQSRKLIGGYRALMPKKSDGSTCDPKHGYDVLDFKLKDRAGFEEMGDLHIHIEKDGTIGVWSNSFKLELDRGI